MSLLGTPKVDKRTKTKTIIPKKDTSSIATEEKYQRSRRMEGSQTKVQNTTNQKRRPSNLTAAVAVKPTSKSSSYADIPKDLKKKIDIGALWVEVSKIRYVLIDNANGNEKADCLKNAVAEALAENAIVRHMQRSTVVEIVDLDGVIVEEEVDPWLLPRKSS